MKELVETIDSRIKSPIFGYYFFLLFSINWKAFFFLLADNGSVEGRIKFFENTTSIATVIFYPFSIALLLAILHPWISYTLTWFNKKPTKLKNSLLAEGEHEFLIQQTEFKRMRDAVLEIEEEKLITRTKEREGKLSEISDDDLRDNLRNEINELRNSISEKNNRENYDIDYKTYENLMRLADDQWKRAQDSNDIGDQLEYKLQAKTLEEKAHKLIIEPEESKDPT